MSKEAALYEPPRQCFSRADGKPIDLTGLFAGTSAFLVCGGPSFARMPRRVPRMLRRPGFLTMGVNNSPRVFRPDLWCCVDEPDHFMQSIFRDPRITKFCPVGKRGKRLFDSNAWEFTDTVTERCPGMNYFVLTHEGFPDGFLTRPDFYWGGWAPKEAPADTPGYLIGGRSVMHVAIKLLWVLGIRRIFLLGADFRMTETDHYAFDQNRHKGSINGNNSTYAKLNERFAVLRPMFEQAGLQVYNCTPGSQLEAFERMDFMDAADLVQAEIGVNTKRERTYGLYERAGIEKRFNKWQGKVDDSLAELKPYAWKMMNNPDKQKFADRFYRKAERFFKNYRRMLHFDGELLELKHYQPKEASNGR